MIDNLIIKCISFLWMKKTFIELSHFSLEDHLNCCPFSEFKTNKTASWKQKDILDSLPSLHYNMKIVFLECTVAFSEPAPWIIFSKLSWAINSFDNLVKVTDLLSEKNAWNTHTWNILISQLRDSLDLAKAHSRNSSW